MDNQLSIGISSCLTGLPVRYDARDKLDPFLVHTWGELINFVLVCPETEAGLGIPREKATLATTPGGVRMIGMETATDFTDRIEEWAALKIGELKRLELVGFILKSNSPSCSLNNSWQDDDPSRYFQSAGIFAAMLKIEFPLLPLIDEKALYKPANRDHFIDRVFLLNRWKATAEKGRERANVVDFHTRNKLCLMAHSPERYKALGKLLVGPEPWEGAGSLLRYQEELLGLLEHRATPDRHAYVLKHVASHFNKTMTSEEAAELNGAIEAYRAGMVGLEVPIALVNHHTRRNRRPYLGMQTYLNPHPLEYKLKR